MCCSRPCPARCATTSRIAADRSPRSRRWCRSTCVRSTSRSRASSATVRPRVPAPAGRNERQLPAPGRGPPPDAGDQERPRRRRLLRAAEPHRARRRSRSSGGSSTCSPPRRTAVMTNVPGPPEPVYVAGTPVRTVLFWAPTSGHMGMSVSIFSYRGEVTVGLMVDAALVPDPDHIAGRLSARARGSAADAEVSAPHGRVSATHTCREKGALRCVSHCSQIVLVAALLVPTSIGLATASFTQVATVAVTDHHAGAARVGASVGLKRQRGLDRCRSARRQAEGGEADRAGVPDRHPLQPAKLGRTGVHAERPAASEGVWPDVPGRKPGRNRHGADQHESGGHSAEMDQASDGGDGPCEGARLRAQRSQHHRRAVRQRRSTIPASRHSSFTGTRLAAA